MPSMDGPWIHCIPGMLYWWIWQPCHQWMGHGIPVGYCTQSGGSGNHAINGWAMVFLGYCTGGSDNHAINGWAMVFLGYFTGGSGHHTINGWPVDSLYSWDTLLVDLATMPSMDGPWIGILYWWIWPPCHQWMGRGFIVFLGYFTGGSGHHAINGWAVDSVYSWDTLLVDLATMPSMDGPWIQCIPGILYWWIWPPCHQWMGHGIPGILYWWIWPPYHQWMGRGFIVFLGYFTGGSGHHAINGWAVDWDTLLVDLATMPSMDGPWIQCIPGILYWWIWTPCHL